MGASFTVLYEFSEHVLTKKAVKARQKEFAENTLYFAILKFC